FCAWPDEVYDWAKKRSLPWVAQLRRLKIHCVSVFAETSVYLVVSVLIDVKLSIAKCQVTIEAESGFHLTQATQDHLQSCLRDIVRDRRSQSAGHYDGVHLLLLAKKIYSARPSLEFIKS
ncbi:hypothetical protein LTS18_006779, partial [Coniosporium uncinatum]